MQSSTAKFWLGLGLGSVLGMIVYRCSRTDKAKELKRKMCCAAQSAADKAGEWMANVKDKTCDVAVDMAKKAELPKPYYTNLAEYKQFKHID